MKIFIGADHRGYKLKAEITELLQDMGHKVVDVGSYEEGESCDYPEFSYKVASRVAASRGTRGILVCMTGIGHTIAANKVPGAYAALCYNLEAAVLSREHNNSNILVLGAKFAPPGSMKEMIKAWLTTKFQGGRHKRRFEMIRQIEKLMASEDDKS